MIQTQVMLFVMEGELLQSLPQLGVYEGHRAFDLAKNQGKPVMLQISGRCARTYRWK